MKFKKINLNNFFRGSGERKDTYPCNSSGIGTGACKKNTGNGSYSGNAQQGRTYADERAESDRNSYPQRNYAGGETATPRCTGGNMRDRGNEPIVFDIRKEAFMTPDFRTALWTGGNLQLTVMTIPGGEETGVERHEGIDQLVGVVSGAGEVAFGNRENYFAPPIPLDAHSVILIPAGTYHNIKNVGRTPLKLYSVYAPKAHKFGTVDKFNFE